MRAWAKRLVGNLVVLAYAPGQRGLPWKTPEEIGRIRDARVRRTVRHAAAFVPYYREMFARLRVDPRSIRGAADLAQLPLVPKSELRRDPTAFVAQTREGRAAVPFSTSGTTGEPAVVRHSHRSLLANIAYGERDTNRMPLPTGIRRGTIRSLEITYETATARTVRKVYDEWTWIPMRPNRCQTSVREPIEHIAGLLDEFRPHVLAGYGAYLETFLRVTHEAGLLRHRPDAVVYGAESMSEEGKRFVEEELGVPVYSQYNAVEAFRIAFNCERRDVFHVHEDLAAVRLVDDAGQEVPPGRPGRVVLSNLVNRGTMLLNYRLDDLAIRSPEACPCGRGLWTLQGLQGRAEDIVWLRDGNFVHPRAVWAVLKGRDEVVRYRLVQREVDRFDLHVWLRPAVDFDRWGREIRPKLTSLLGGASIDLRQAEGLDLQREGKFRPVVALPRPGAAGAGR